MMSKVLSIRIPSSTYAALERAAAIAGITITEAQKTALAEYLRMEDDERQRRAKAAILEQLAKISAELRQARGAIVYAVESGNGLSEGDRAKWVAALEAIEVVAARLAP